MICTAFQQFVAQLLGPWPVPAIVVGLGLSLEPLTPLYLTVCYVYIQTSTLGGMLAQVLTSRHSKHLLMPCICFRGYL